MAKFWRRTAVRKFQRSIIAFFTFFSGLYFFLEFVLPKKIGEFQFGFYHQEILKGLQVVTTMAIGLGILSIVRVHSRNIRNQNAGWLNSVALLTSFSAMLFFQASVTWQDREINSVRKRLEIARKFVTVVEQEKESKPPIPRLEALETELQRVEAEVLTFVDESPEIKDGFKNAEDAVRKLRAGVASGDFSQSVGLITSLSALSGSVIGKLEERQAKSFTKRAENIINNGLFIPLGSAMFALLAFYVAHAAYRSFRIRSAESFLLMAAAVIVMLGQIPQGTMYVSESLPAIRLWLLKNISTPAFRAIFFGSTIAGLAMALRIWFSLEKGPLEKDGGAS